MTMRITTKLQDIAIRAQALRLQRGDTEWNDQERAQINMVHELIDAIPVSPPQDSDHTEIRR